MISLVRMPIWKATNIRSHCNEGKKETGTKPVDSSLGDIKVDSGSCRDRSERKPLRSCQHLFFHMSNVMINF
jgi:hypothetical protein